MLYNLFYKIKTLFLKVLKYLIIYIIILLILIEFYYKLMGFNNHVYYQDDIQASQFGLECEEEQLITSDKFMINTYQVHAENPNGVVIILTGIQWPDVKYYFSHSKLFLEQGFSSVLVDVRGHGNSSGDEITFAIDDVRDVSAVVDDLVRDDRYSDLPIIVMGVSMGGATAINSASVISEIDGLISMSAFSSWIDVCLDTLELSGIPNFICEMIRPVLMLHGYFNFGNRYLYYEPKELIKNIDDKKCLFIHSKDDMSVPVSNYFRLMENYDGRNGEMWLRDGNNHFITGDILNIENDEEYCSVLIEFLNGFVKEENKK